MSNFPHQVRPYCKVTATTLKLKQNVCRTWLGSVCGIGGSNLKKCKGFSKPNSELGPNGTPAPTVCLK
jgi:hypothetical protein